MDSSDDGDAIAALPHVHDDNAHVHDDVYQQIAELGAMWRERTPTQTLIPVPRLALDGMLFEVDAVAVIPNS